MSEMGPKGEILAASRCRAVTPITDMQRLLRHVRLVPEAEMALTPTQHI
jgi:hypothetical protein